MRRHMKILYVALAVFISTLVVSQTTHSIPTTITVGTIGIVAELLLSDFLNEAKQAATTLLDDIPNVADRVISRAANEMLILARELELSSRDLLDTTIGELDENTQRVVTAILALQSMIEDQGSATVEALDTASLDLEAILGQTIFSTSRFLLKRIDGINQINKTEGDYRITITGSEFGSTSIRLMSFRSAGEDILNALRINPVSNHTIHIDIPNAVLKPFFMPKTVRSLPITMDIIRSNHEGRSRLTHEFYIFLSPRYAGTITLHLYKRPMDGST